MTQLAFEAASSILTVPVILTYIPGIALLTASILILILSSRSGKLSRRRIVLISTIFVLGAVFFTLSLFFR